jgi:iron complex transport system substrate-binding protein
MLNLTNIADTADKGGHGYPKLSPEYIISSNPDLIILPGKKSSHIEKIIQRPGWKHISAVKNNKFFQVESDIASRWGPRVPEFANSIVDFLEPN